LLAVQVFLSPLGLFCHRKAQHSERGQQNIEGLAPQAIDDEEIDEVVEKAEVSEMACKLKHQEL